MTMRALIVGGTGGIGYAMAYRIAADSVLSTVIISGRTKPRDIPHSNIEFRPLDASSMRSIKQYTDTYKQATDQKLDQKLDLLVLTQGILSTAGRIETPEGIDRKMALHFYGRQLLIRELAPVLKHNAKVMLVLDGERGNPASINWEDLGLKTHYSLSNVAKHCISMTDAMIQAHAMHQADQTNGRRQFLHALPGIVNTNIYEGLPWYLQVASRTVGYFFGVSPEICAESLLKSTRDIATSGKEEEQGWACINGKGHIIHKKAKWSEEQIKKVADHTWKVVDDAISTS